MKSRDKMIILAILLMAIIIMIVSVSIRNNRVKSLDIILIPKIIDETNEFWTALFAGANMAASEYGATIRIVAPDREDDYEGQEELIMWAIEQQPDAILLAPSHYTKITPAVENIINNGIELVMVDSYIDKDLGKVLVATDNILAGRKLGELVNGYIKVNSHIAVIGHVREASTAIERIEGLKEELGDNASMIVTTLFCDSSYDKAYELTDELLDTYPEVDIIVGTNEYASVGIAEAVKIAGKKDDIKVIGFDNSIEEVRYLEEGILDGLVVQNPFNMGYLAVEQVVKALSGEIYDAFVDSGSESITVENMYSEENQKLLFPFVGSQYRTINQNK